MSSSPRFTIIIPVVSVNAYVREGIERILDLEVSDWEAIVVTNATEESPTTDPRVIMMMSGRAGPGAKRDLAARVARGQILVFLDDDSYPQPNFLNVLSRDFNAGLQAVGGPAITPVDDTFWQQVSGAVYASRLSGGAPHRILPVGQMREVVDWPTVNFSIDRSLFLAMGGFDCTFWPGEDTFLCDKLTENGHQIWYDPELVVWHHRRKSLRGHLKQVGGYGLHRGYFARRFPTSSRRWSYFIPSLMVIALSITVVTLIVLPDLGKFFVLPWFVYLFALSIATIQIALRISLGVAVMCLPYTFMTHVWYGLRFIKGFTMKKELSSKLR